MFQQIQIFCLSYSKNNHIQKQDKHILWKVKKYALVLLM